MAKGSPSIGQLIKRIHSNEIAPAYSLFGNESFLQDFLINYAKRKGYKLVNSKAYERLRIGGRKKVNPFKDGLIILIYLIRLFFIRS